MLILTLSFILLALLVYWKQYGCRIARMLNKFPGPILLPVIGNGLDLLFRSPVQIVEKLVEYTEKYKQNYRLWLGFTPNIHIFNPQDAEAILSSNKHLKRSKFYEFLRNWLHDGLFLAHGEKWHLQRKILTPAFHFNILHSFIGTFHSQTIKIINELKSKCDVELEVSSFIYRLTLAVICESALGIKMDFEGKDQNYLDTSHKLTRLLAERFHTFYYHSDIVYNLSSLSYKEKEYLKVLHEFTRIILKERDKNFKPINMEDGKYKPKQKLAVLDLLLDYKYRTGEIDDQGIMNELNFLTFAGNDTTAVSLIFTLMLLANHKDVQDKVYQECVQIFGNSDRPTTFDDVQAMDYLDMVIKESLRLFPSVPIISRLLGEDLVLSNGVAPAGCMANIFIYFLHRDARVWPDPERFDPDRFLPENVNNRHPFSHIAFSAGYRNCLGRRFAMFEMKCFLSTVVRHFTIHPVTTEKDIIIDADSILRNHTPIKMKLQHRQKDKN